MITKIGFELAKNNKNNAPKKSQVKTSQYASQEFENAAGKLNLNYFVPFTGKKERLNGATKLDTIMYYTDTPAKKMIKELKAEAKESGYGEVTTLHVIRRALVDSEKYIEDLDNEVKDYNTDYRPAAAAVFMEDVTSDMFSSPKSRKKVLPVIKENIAAIDNLLSKNKPQKTDNEITLSDDLTDSIWDVRDEKETVTPYIIMDAAFSSDDIVTAEFTRDLNLALKKVLMIKDEKPTMMFSAYEPKAENIMKNLALGTNIFVTYDAEKETPNSFIHTVRDLLEKNDKYDVTELNLSTSSDYFASVVNLLAKDKTKQHIIIANPSAISLNDDVADDSEFDPDLMSDDLTKTIANPPANIKFVLYDTRDNYYSTISSNPSMYNQFEEAAVPALSTKQMIKFFRDLPLMMKDVQVPFSKKALEKTVEASTQLDGPFPTKSVQLMKKIAAYYVDKKEINESDVAKYIKEVSNLFKKDADDGSIDIIFNTGKKIKGMVGKTSTQKEAQLIVKQIKSNKMGTKGIILYSQDGSTGSGRRFTAKAIAGEARVPYIEMNAVDFGTKDVDLFGGGGAFSGKSS